MKMFDWKFPHVSELPEVVRIPPIQARILIAGQIMESGFETKKVFSPCSLRGEDGVHYFPEIGETSHVSAEIFNQATKAAASAWKQGRGEWPSSSLSDRIRALEEFLGKLKTLRDPIGKLLMWEIAKTSKDAFSEFDRTISYIEDTLQAARDLVSESQKEKKASGISAWIQRAPLGVTLCMGPFNYPLNETFTTLIPALLMGNPLVVKIPRFGQLFWDYLLEPFSSCFPPGVVNVVNGEGKEIISDAVRSGKIDVLAFIGSSRVANQIKSFHPRPHHFRSILGLDAKNPAIILPDASLENAVAECVKGSLSFNGQRCTALKILFVHRSVEVSFLKLFSEKVDQLKCGLPWEEGVSITPLADPSKPRDLDDYLTEALKANAKVVTKRSGSQPGSFFYPTVLSQVGLKTRIAREEQFGPIVPVVTYDSIEEVEAYLMESPYGLQASLFGKEPSQMARYLDVLTNQVSRININSQCQRGPDLFPFTGRKNSAEGTLSVTDALRSFSIRVMVSGSEQEASTIQNVTQKSSFFKSESK